MRWNRTAIFFILVRGWQLSQVASNLRGAAHSPDRRKGGPAAIKRSSPHPLPGRKIWGCLTFCLIPGLSTVNRRTRTRWGCPSWRVTYRSRPVGSPWGLGLDTPGTRKNVQGRCGAEKTSSSEVLTSRLAMAGVSFWLLRELRESLCRG